MSLTDDAKQLAQGLIQGAVAKVVALVPDGWVPGGTPDPLIRHRHGHVGRPVSRIDGPLKVAGQARFAGDVHPGGRLSGRLTVAIHDGLLTVTHLDLGVGGGLADDSALVDCARRAMTALEVRADGHADVERHVLDLPFVLPLR